MKAITIEQTPEEAKLAFDVHRRATIADIRLTKAEMHARRPLAPRLNVTYAHRARAVEADPGILRIEVTFAMRGSAPDAADSRTPDVGVKCAFEVDYQLETDFEPTQAQINAFKDGNAIFNAWPYFREYLHSSVQRMGLPALITPFLRLQPARASEPKPGIQMGKQAPEASVSTVRRRASAVKQSTE